MENLIAKAKSLNAEGVSCYAYTGSYHLPLKTFTKRIIDDVVYIEEIIGVGEIAISDHRGSQPTIEELTRLTSDARVGGILSKKASIVNVHVGRGKNFVGPLIEVVKKSDLPIAEFLPTHMNKGKESMFDEKGNFLKLDVVDVCTLFKEVKDCVIQEDIPLEEALKVITSNPANFLKVENKG
jgi:beta-aspartyl-dipeptidase (metallo-type)